MVDTVYILELRYVYGNELIYRKVYKTDSEDCKKYIEEIFMDDITKDGYKKYLREEVGYIYKSIVDVDII